MLFKTPVVHNLVDLYRLPSRPSGPRLGHIQNSWLSYKTNKNLVGHIISFFAFHIFPYLLGFVVPILIHWCLCLLLFCLTLPSPFCFPSHLSSFAQIVLHLDLNFLPSIAYYFLHLLFPQLFSFCKKNKKDRLFWLLEKNLEAILEWTYSLEF